MNKLVEFFRRVSLLVFVIADDGKMIEDTFEFVEKVNNTSYAMTVTNGKFKVNFQ